MLIMLKREQKNLSVFILEDNEGDAFFTQELLVDLGFESDKISIVSSIRKLIQLSKIKKPDILLLDLFLKDSSGFGTYNRAQEILPYVPIVVLSGITDKEIALKTVMSGAQDFLIKGEYDENTLLKTIRYAIERKKNTDQIADSKAKYEQLFQENPLPMAIINATDYRFSMINNAAVNLFGFSKLEFSQMKFFDLCKMDDVAKDMEKDNFSGAVKEIECITKNKEDLFIEIKGNPIVLNNIHSHLIYMNDITEKKLFEAEKLKLVNETQSYERNRFSMELHDGLGQHLIALNFFLSQLNESDTIDKTVMDRCFQIVNLSLNQTRSLCYNLTPPELEFGLLAALPAMFERLNSLNKIQFKLVVADNVSDLHFVEIDCYNLYRIIQEFVNNSIKHSQASMITCKIKLYNGQIKFQVEDNGIGFDVTKVKFGLGLKNFEQRSKLLNIDFKLKSTNAGTKLSFLIH